MDERIPVSETRKGGYEQGSCDSSKETYQATRMDGCLVATQVQYRYGQILSFFKRDGKSGSLNEISCFYILTNKQTY